MVTKPSSKAEEIANRLRQQAKSLGMEESEDPEVIFSVGGDGTLLKAVKFGLPVVSIRGGRRGHLVDVPPERTEEILKRLMEGDFSYEHYQLLEIEGEVVFNEVAVVSEEAETIILSVTMRDSKVEFEGDGVMVSTPQGSSGWSLSAGGPLVDSKCDVMLVTSMNPVMCPVKSYVFRRERANVRMGNKGYVQRAKVYIDGEFWRFIKSEEGFDVLPSERSATVIRFFNNKGVYKC